MLSKFRKFFIFFLLWIPPVILANEIEVRKITPPNLGSKYLGKKILCHRPVRHGAPKMAIEQKYGKIIAHNYGHGGSGWTLGPGSAEYVNNLLIKYKDNLQSSFRLTKNTPITIIGAGALGLFTAYDLQKQGFNNLTIIAAQFEHLASHNAGGLLAPVSMDNDPAIQQTIDQIGVDAYKFYAAIAKKVHPDFSEGAIIVPTYFENREDSGLEPYVGKVMQPAKDVILDFGNGTTRNMVVYDDGIFIDTARMMSDLTNYLKKKKIKFIKKEIKSFTEIKGPVIINCTGLGSAALNEDTEMVSIQGHLIMLKNQVPKDLQYMILIYLKDGVTESGQKIKRSFYIFPKHLTNTQATDIGVLGGTFIEGASKATPNNKEFDILLQGAKDFYGIK
ncbi:FAD-dependent oxidoreductase [Candidatus Tisiphia endosymbiont of Nemotelus uliginosus]|uniref:FAD-dependent oxidoreductase n=1 Tax=Candidatus Tisiphia endosymbiont of Nemotelus uliginosus TaxID=3077926 RepID=UPI0035C91D27